MVNVRWGVVAVLLAALCRADFLPATSPLVSWHGRTVPQQSSGGVTFDWIGVSATVTVSNNFTILKATIIDNCSNGNKFVVRATAEGFRQLDVATLYTSPAQTEYVLFASAGRLSFWGETATFKLIKAVEARFTQCGGDNNLTVVGFSTDGVFLPPPPPSNRRMAILGDSITAGDLLYCSDLFGNHMSMNNSLWADNWGLSYGSLLCEALGADCEVEAHGGIGLLMGDVPSWTWPTLPDLYGSALNWDAYTAGQGAPFAYPWNFSNFIPQAVIIALGTNDAAGERFNNATFARDFQSRYVQFVHNISTIYTAASGGAVVPKFFLAAGPMTNAYLPSVQIVLANLTAAGVSATYLNFTLPNGEPCACGHPSAANHLTMANAALPVISHVMNW